MINHRPYRFAIIVLLCIGNLLTAQELRILEIGSNRPIAGAYILSEDGTYGATTDVDGSVQLRNLSKPYSLTVQHPAYQNETLTDSELVQMSFQVYLSKSESTLPTYTIRANRVREAYNEVSNDVDIIQPKELHFKQAANSSDLLTASPKVYVQKSQLGGGSPVLRGLEANKVLLVVDGLKMNNAIYRSGHVQNALTIDHSMIDQVEVVFGPGSLVYGSDALGGVLHFHTRDPQFGLENKLAWKVNANSQYASAYRGLDNHLDISVGSEKIAYLASFSRHHFDDLRIGARRSHGDDNWDLRNQYIERVDGQDVVRQNDDPNVMRFSGFDQYDLLQKLRVKLSDDLEWYTNMQYSTSTDIPRSDKLNDVDDDGQLRFAEWSYGPQRRFMLLSGLRKEKITRLHDEYNFSLAYQKIEESRYNRRLFSNQRTERLELLDIFTLNYDAIKDFGPAHCLQYGAEFNYNTLESQALIRDIDSENQTTSTSTRYPSGDNYTSQTGVYLRHKWKASERFLVNGGLRLNNDRLQSNFLDATFLELPFTENSYNNWALTGNLGLNFKPKKGHQFVASIGTGYRSPNIDDIGKIFDFEPGKVVIPSSDIVPENAYSIDLTYNLSQEKLNLELSTYYTYLTNAIRREAVSHNGDNTIIYEGEEATTFANNNVGEARIYGATIFAQYFLLPQFSLSGQLTFTDGLDISSDSPLGHIPPTFGGFNARYETKDWTFAFVNEWNAEKPLEKYSETSEDKLSEALENGTPKWMLWHYKMQYQLSEKLRLNAAVENLLDEHYKPFASGISGPGRNFKIGAAISF